MNQAELLRLLASRDQKKRSTQSLFDQRLATNISLIKTQFFSLYQEKEHKVFFNTLLNTLESLFKNRPKELQNQDIDRLNSGNWYQSEQMVGMKTLFSACIGLKTYFHNHISLVAEGFGGCCHRSESVRYPDDLFDLPDLKLVTKSGMLFRVLESPEN